MKRERESGMFWIAVIFWLAAIFVAFNILLCSCGSKKVITEYVAVHDTLVVTHSDTIRIESIKTKTDTLREVTIKEITLLKDTFGRTDTIRIETTNDHYRYVYEGDSSGIYRVAVDSILKALDKQREREEVKTKPLVPWWQYALFVAVILAACVWVLKHWSRLTGNS